MSQQGTAEGRPDERMAGELAPGGFRPFVRLRWKALVNIGLLLVGLVVQVVLVQMMFELVDLAISLMEVWAELARKHLEITL